MTCVLAVASDSVQGLSDGGDSDSVGSRNTKKVDFLTAASQTMLECANRGPALETLPFWQHIGLEVSLRWLSSSELGCEVLELSAYPALSVFRKPSLVISI